MCLSIILADYNLLTVIYRLTHFCLWFSLFVLSPRAKTKNTISILPYTMKAGRTILAQKNLPDFQRGSI